MPKYSPDFFIERHPNFKSLITVFSDIDMGSKRFPAFLNMVVIIQYTFIYTIIEEIFDPS